MRLLWGTPLLQDSLVRLYLTLYKGINNQNKRMKKFDVRNTKLLLVALSSTLILIGCKKDTSDRHNQGSWSTYRADAASSNYSPLDQINTSNVAQLQPAWTFEMKDMAADSRPGLSQCTPIVVDGVLYTMSAKSLLYALDAQTGEQIWFFDPFNGEGGGGTVRGVTYWESGQDKRIIFGSGDRLIAVNAETGRLVEEFGTSGSVDLKIGLRDDPSDLFVALTTPGIIYEDLIIVGGRLEDLYGSPPGYIRAYSCRTGELAWTFHTIPLPGEPGYETWPKEAYKTAGGVNNWAGMSVDQERDMVFISLGSPSYDFYGADRLGQNLYGNCVLALKASSGEYVWHYQTVHHDLWDYDLPAPPNLVTLNKDGDKVDAVAQITKQGFVFVLDRETGEPVFPVEEREVPPSDMPGEQAWPTQPFPTKPQPFARQTMTTADLSHFSEADNEALKRQFDSLRYEGMYTPPALKGTVMIPGTRGGAQWGGAAFDTETNIMYIRSLDVAELMTIVERDPAKIAAQSLIEQGVILYQNYCASCHGNNRQGNGAIFPELVNLKTRLTRAVSEQKIAGGVGQMPGFSRALSEEEIESLLAFLYEEEDRQLVVEETDKTVDEKIQYFNISGYTTWIDQSGHPAIRPPWGTLNALNLSTGEYEWQIRLGNHEELQEQGGPITGQEGKAGPIVTGGGLIFISGSEDKQLRAMDKVTGEILWQTTLPAMNNATACTYQVGGKQFVVLSVGGTEENPSGSVMAFSL